MNKFCQLISVQFYVHGIIVEDEINPLRFAFELIISQVMTYLAMILMGVFLHRFYETIIYCILFGALRKRIQGYHAKTFMMCFFLTILNYAIIILIAEFSFPYYILNLITFIFILVFFHAEDKKKICYLSILYFLVLIILAYKHYLYLISMCTLIYVTVIIMRVIGGIADEHSNC